MPLTLRSLPPGGAINLTTLFVGIVVSTLSITIAVVTWRLQRYNRRREYETA